MATQIIALDYDGASVFFQDDGWFNATAAASRFGKRPVDWLRQQEAKDYIAALGAFLKSDPDALYKTRKGKCVAGTWLHPRLAVPFSRWLDVRFAVWCDVQIDALLRKDHPHFDWKRMRHEATSSYKVMQAVLQLRRQDDGKPTAPHHYSNEARLINWALTGEFKGLDRDALSGADLDLLAKLEERNAVLIGCGLPYADRKRAMECFAGDRRARLAA